MTTELWPMLRDGQERAPPERAQECSSGNNVGICGKGRVSRETVLCGSNRRLLPRLAVQIGRQNPECGRRQAIEPPRLPHRARTRSFKLCTSLVGKSGHHAVVDIADDQPLIASEGIDIGGLTLEIDVVFGFDLEMNRDRWLNGRQFGPDATYLRPADLRIGEQFEGRAAMAILVERQPMP